MICMTMLTTRKPLLQSWPPQRMGSTSPLGSKQSP